MRSSAAALSEPPRSDCVSSGNVLLFTETETALRTVQCRMLSLFNDMLSMRNCMVGIDTK